MTVLPEMFNTGFSLPTGELARRSYECGVTFLRAVAEERGTHVAASLPNPKAGSDRIFNTMFVFGPSGLVGEYSKIHTISILGENVEYEGGTEPLLTSIGGLKICFFICYDLRFPEIFSEVACDTDLYVVAANWPLVRHSHWRTLLDARAIENQAYVAGVNRVGEGGGLTFLGGSKIISPSGEVMAEAGSEEDVLLADVHACHVKSLRAAFPCSEDRAAARARRKGR